MTTTELSKMILELNSEDSLYLPSYRAEEVTAVENLLRNCKTGLRTILTHQRAQVEATSSAYNETEEQLQRLLESKRPCDKTILQLEAKIAQLKKDLDIQTKPPNAAIIIEISRIQQLKRGLNIYHQMRLQRILSILLFECLLDSRERSRLGYRSIQGKHSELQPSKALLEKCSPSEQQMVEYLVGLLKEYGFDESFRHLPMHPSEDHGVGWIQPPTWLLDLTKSFMNSSQADPKLQALFGDVTTNENGECLEWTYANIALPPTEDDS